MTKQHIEILRCIIDNHSHNVDITDARAAIDGEIYFCIEG